MPLHHSPLRRRLLLATAAAAASPAALAQGAAGYPNKPIKINVAREVLNLQAKLDLVHVPYTGAAPIVNDLLGGQVTSDLLDTANLRPLVQGGKVKVLALPETQRAAILPQVPTFLALGYKGLEPVGFFMALAPAGTPKDIVAKLSDGFTRAIRGEEITTKLLEFGQEPTGSTAD